MKKSNFGLRTVESSGIFVPLLFWAHYASSRLLHLPYLITRMVSHPPRSARLHPLHSHAFFSLQRSLLPALSSSPPAPTALHDSLRTPHPTRHPLASFTPPFSLLPSSLPPALYPSNPNSPTIHRFASNHRPYLCTSTFRPTPLHHPSSSRPLQSGVQRSATSSRSFSYNIRKAIFLRDEVLSVQR